MQPIGRDDQVSRDGRSIVKGELASRDVYRYDLDAALQMHSALGHPVQQLSLKPRLSQKPPMSARELLRRHFAKLIHLDS